MAAQSGRTPLQLPQRHWQVPQSRDSNRAHPVFLVSFTTYQNMHYTQDTRNMVRQLPSGFQSWNTCKNSIHACSGDSTQSFNTRNTSVTRPCLMLLPASLVKLHIVDLRGLHQSQWSNCWPAEHSILWLGLLPKTASGKLQSSFKKAQTR